MMDIYDGNDVVRVELRKQRDEWRALAVQLAEALDTSEFHGTEKYEWQKNRRVVLDAAKKAGLIK